MLKLLLLIKLLLLLEVLELEREGGRRGFELERDRFDRSDVLWFIDRCEWL